MRPLIGITTSELRPGTLSTLRREGLAPHPELMLGTTYPRAIAAAGGVPVILAPLDLDAVPDLVARLDGICLSGGPDLDPIAYGALRRHPELGATQPDVDAFELAVARAADAAGLPLLGICRGAQALNVARGGTLHQHIEGHRQADLATVPTQRVTVAADSLLAALTGGDGTLEVNSFHHQAVDVPGTGLRVVARAPDGTAEAIEDRARPLLLGVQWHAETLIERREHGALFAALVEAALGPAASPPWPSWRGRHGDHERPRRPGLPSSRSSARGRRGQRAQQPRRELGKRVASWFATGAGRLVAQR